MMYKGSDRVLRLVAKKSMSVPEIAAESGLNEDSVRRIAEALKAEGYVTIESRESVLGVPTDEFAGYARGVFPEAAVHAKAQKGASVADLAGAERSIGIRWARVKGFVLVEGGKLIAEKSAEEVEAAQRAMKSAFEQISKTGKCDDPVLFEELFERKLITRKMERTSSISYTGKDIDWPAFGEGFDVNVPGPDAPLGKNHPVTTLTNRIRTIMSELGFEEMEGDIVESSFWNFDALFQPQDHPARELADTFYLEGETPLPGDESLVGRVRKAHEDGWKYKWDPKEASKTVLRTHTTAVSARYVAAIKDGKPRRYFAVGRVFRNEATDYKHLAEFHQVEGIISWEGATFRDLLGILKEIYGKLGFEKIRFRPSFFPYTEPSLEIEVYFEERKQWMELGGAGIFRPEVSVPLAGVYPVLAWGLSLERPLMLKLELDDIRTLYRNDLDFLSSARLDL